MQALVSGLDPADTSLQTSPTRFALSLINHSERDRRGTALKRETLSRAITLCDLPTHYDITMIDEKVRREDRVVKRAVKPVDEACL